VRADARLRGEARTVLHARKTAAQSDVVKMPTIPIARKYTTHNL
jgi:hypothetical protein